MLVSAAVAVAVGGNFRTVGGRWPEAAVVADAQNGILDKAANEPHGGRRRCSKLRKPCCGHARGADSVEEVRQKQKTAVLALGGRMWREHRKNAQKRAESCCPTETDLSYTQQ